MATSAVDRDSAVAAVRRAELRCGLYHEDGSWHLGVVVPGRSTAGVARLLRRPQATPVLGVWTLTEPVLVVSRPQPRELFTLSGEPPGFVGAALDGSDGALRAWRRFDQILAGRPLPDAVGAVRELAVALPA